MSDEEKHKGGFNYMSKTMRQRISSMGGRAAHEKKTAHEWTSEEARIAGKKGGLSRGRNRRNKKEVDVS